MPSLLKPLPLRLLPRPPLPLATRSNFFRFAKKPALGLAFLLADFDQRNVDFTHTSLS
jgi:hypothetical protein